MIWIVKILGVPIGVDMLSHLHMSGGDGIAGILPIGCVARFTERKGQTAGDSRDARELPAANAFSASKRQLIDSARDEIMPDVES